MTVLLPWKSAFKSKAYDLAFVLFAFLLTVPFPALAAAGAGHEAFGPILFSLGMIVIIAKFAGFLCERFGQPSVLGELLVGILLGNVASSLLTRVGFGFIRSDPTLQILAEMGVLILLFDVGLEVDLRAMVRVGPSAMLVASSVWWRRSPSGGRLPPGCSRTVRHWLTSSLGPHCRPPASESRREC